MVRVGRVVLDIAAQSDDKVIDSPSVGVFMNAPDLLEDLLAGDDLTFPIGKISQQIGFHQGQVGNAVRGDEFQGVEPDGAMV